MTNVFVPPQLQALIDGRPSVELPGETVRQLLRVMHEKYPQLAARLWDGEKLLPGWMVSIDGRVPPNVMSAKLSQSREVHFLPAIGGG
jgi:molybdopterin converting factor small subunit